MLILFILFAQSLEKLTLIQPESLIDKLGSEIKYGIAHFGEIPWGQRMIGTLIPTYPNFGCDSILPSKDHEFIFIERGECTFVTKVKNAQNAGFKFVIIGDFINEDIDNSFTMLYDGSGSSIHIPSIIIGNKWTSEFQDIFNNHPANSEYTIKLLMKFDIIKQRNVNVLFSIDLLNNNTLQIISEYKPYQELFDSQDVNYQFLYPIYSLKMENDETTIIYSSNCISEGRYCIIQSIIFIYYLFIYIFMLIFQILNQLLSNRFYNTYDPDGDDYGTGEDVIEEIIRQICLQKLNIDMFFNYLDLFKDQCKIPYMYEYCFSELLIQLNYPLSKVQSCYDNSFIQLNPTSKSDLNTYNSLLEEQLEIISEFPRTQFPPVMLNNHFVVQNITAQNIFINVCQSFLNPPEICSKQSDDLHIEDLSQQSNSFLQLLIILLAVLLIFLLVATLVYKKIVKRAQQEQTTEQVHELVTQYITFVESKASKQKNSQ